ncbi:LPXTG cell wall anchor domain-containing protein [Merdimonas faecis]|uniref:LPXTG cell wall anchor domain-containing protein n=1 Tax=Merdimonas faecis TaxID=1653435 RepID=UPI0023F7AE1B|nr:LPXTG cell wall anchor domain-containing protein [Merdimonas faecis]
MYRKKLLKMCLVTTLAVSMAAANMTAVMPNQAGVVQAADEKTKTVGVNYWDTENNAQVGEGKVSVAVDANNVNTSALTDVPEGYELVSTGDVAINGGWIFVEVRPAAQPVTKEIGVNYWDVENNAQAGEGKVTVTADANNVNTSALTDVPEGYELVSTGDVAINDGWIFVEVRPVAQSVTKEIGVNYWDVENNAQAGEGKVTVTADANNVNTSALTDVPEGYELVSTGDVAINDGWIFVEVRPVAQATGTIINVVFNDEAGNNLGGGDFTVDKDGDGIFNLSEIKAPVGYTLNLKGDQFVTDYAGKTTILQVTKVNKGTIVNVVFEDRQGNNLGGGDYLVDLDGDGVANYSELSLPVGYKLIETGDFFVKEGNSYKVILDKVESSIIHVVFKSEGGKILGGGDFFVDPDGDGVANYSELTLPEGYELIETGDFFVDTEKTYEITLNKEIEGTIINVVYVDEEGNNLGGGDFFVDKDDDGIANYSELDLPEGYELVQTGDFFVNAGESYTIELRKIQEGTIINVVFEDENGNNLGGGDYLVDADGDGIANYSELELPVGYELIETGDFFVKDGEHYTIILKMRETILTVTFEDTEGNVVGTQTLEADVAGSPEETHHFVLGEDFQLPEGYQLAEGVDQITDIEIPYGSVGGHTMIVEAVSKEEPVDPENPGTSGNPDDTQESQDTKEEADNQKAAEQKTEDSKTPKTGDNTPVGAAAAAAGVSLAAIAAVIAKKRKF